MSDFRKKECCEFIETTKPKMFFIFIVKAMDQWKPIDPESR